jgi:hypothetical protein
MGAFEIVSDHQSPTAALSARFLALSGNQMISSGFDACSSFREPLQVDPY